MPDCANCDAKIGPNNKSKNGFCNNCAEHQISSSPSWSWTKPGSRSSSTSKRSRSSSTSKRSRSKRSRSRRSPPNFSPESPASKKRKSIEGGSRKRRNTRKRRKNRK